MTCLNPRPLGKSASVDIIFPRKKIFSYSGADLRVSCRGSNSPPPPPPLRRPVGFYYNWYSVLKFVYITSQLCYSLCRATPSKKNPGSAPVLDYWKGLFSSPVISIPWTALNTMVNDDNFGKINSRQTPLQKHSNSDISCAGVSLSSL